MSFRTRTFSRWLVRFALVLGVVLLAGFFSIYVNTRCDDMRQQCASWPMPECYGFRYDDCINSRNAEAYSFGSFALRVYAFAVLPSLGLIYVGYRIFWLRPEEND
jgi:hypothetical protein